MTQEGEVDAVARGSLDMMFSSPFLISDQLPYLTMFTAAYIFRMNSICGRLWMVRLAEGSG